LTFEITSEREIKGFNRGMKGEFSASDLGGDAGFAAMRDFLTQQATEKVSRVNYLGSFSGLIFSSFSLQS
jgi:hypothetical protein